MRNKIVNGGGGVREIVSSPSDGGEDELVENGDEDDKRNWVEVAEEIVGESVGVHHSGLGSQVVVDLIIAVEGEGGGWARVETKVRPVATARRGGRKERRRERTIASKEGTKGRLCKP